MAKTGIRARSALAGVYLFALAFALPAGAVELRWPEGTARGYPAMVDPVSGSVLARGSHRQWVERGKLHVVTRFDFRDGRRVEETAVFQQSPELAQESWRWAETRGAQTMRSFQVDFSTGVATGMKLDQGKESTWAEHLNLPRGESFAGGGFAFAVKNLVERLERGEVIELTAVGITPKPRAIRVRVSKTVNERLQMAGHELDAIEVTIHPEVPWIARPFVKAPDNHLWFVLSPPVALLRAEGPLLEPSDPQVRIDVEPSQTPRAAGRASPAR